MTGKCKSEFTYSLDVIQNMAEQTLDELATLRANVEQMFRKESDVPTWQTADLRTQYKPYR